MGRRRLSIVFGRLRRAGLPVPISTQLTVHTRSRAINFMQHALPEDKNARFIIQTEQALRSSERGIYRAVKHLMPNVSRAPDRSWGLPGSPCWNQRDAARTSAGEEARETRLPTPTGKRKNPHRDGDSHAEIPDPHEY